MAYPFIHHQLLLPAAVVADYVTFDPARKGSDIVLSSGNRIAARGAGGVWSTALCLNGKSTGLWYFEFTLTFNPANGFAVGIGKSTMNLNDVLGRDADGWGYYTAGGANSIFNNSSFTSYGPSFTTGDVIGGALNLTTGKVWFSKNGTFQGSPTADTGQAVSGLSGTFYCGISSSGNGDQGFANSSIYSPPSGFSQWT